MVEENNGEKKIIEFDPAPEWLTQNYMQDALRTYHKDNHIVVKSIVIKPVTGKGEHYASIMTRISVEYVNGKNVTNCESFIVKTSFESDPIAAAIIRPYDAFNREMAVYSKIMPQMLTLLHEINDHDHMFAEAIAVDYEKSALIFEDLSARSFIMANRLSGLDMVHTKIVLKKLAKLHATSAVLNERHPGIFDGYDKGIFNQHTKSFSPLFVGCIEACGLMVSEWQNYEQYGKKLIKLKSKLMDNTAKLFEPKDNEFNVMTHGDFWVNNVMFKFDDHNKPIDAVLIDFQFCAWASPAIDLHYFFNTSLKEEMRRNQQDELLQFYHRNICEILLKLNFSGYIPTLHQFRMEFLDKSFYAVISTCVVQPIMLNEETADADFEALIGTSERAIQFRNILYKNNTVQENLRNLLPVLDQRGLLD